MTIPSRHHPILRFSLCALLLFSIVFVVACQSTVEEAQPLPAAEFDPETMMSEPLSEEEIETHRGEPGVVRLRWKTESEENSFGFDVMRGSSEEGPFEPANETVIAAAGTSSTPREYIYYDTSVKVGEQYYYYIVEISLAGETEEISPRLPVTVNRMILNSE